MKRIFSITFGILSFLSCGSNSDDKNQENTGTRDTTEIVNNIPVQQMKAGETIYNRYCMACHQKDGSGVPKLYPPVSKTEMVLNDEEGLIKIIIEGMQGETVVLGKTYNNIMPRHDFLNNEQIADLLTYVRNSFGNDAGAIEEEKVAKIRKALQDD